MIVKINWIGSGTCTGTTQTGQQIPLKRTPNHSPLQEELEALDLVLTGLGSCSTLSVLHILRKSKINVAECRTQVEPDISYTDPPDIKAAHIHFDFYGESLPEATIARAIKLSNEKYCTVSKILRRAGIEISHSLDIHPTRSGSPLEDIEEPSLTTQGLHHVALTSSNYEASRKFYTEVMNMQVEWEPDSDNVYLTNGNDNLAIHRGKPEDSRLDHIGFILESEATVDQWYEHLQNHDIPVEKAPKTHRDGARSFYVTDPDGVLVQLIYHPPLSDKKPNP